MAVTTSYPLLPGENGLANYLNKIRAFPILSAEEEFMLAKRYQDYGEAEAAHKLVTSHLRLVAKIAMKFQGYGLPVADLISEGNLGLMRAVKKFEPDRGFRLSTYAMWWIRAAVTEYVLRSWSMVKLGSVVAQKKLFFSLRKAKQNLGIIEAGNLSPNHAEQLSDKFGLSANDIAHMDRRMLVRDLSLNSPVTEGEEGAEYMDTLADEGPDPEAVAGQMEEADARVALLREAMSGLDERTRYIFIERRLKEDPLTLAQLGKQFGLSRERIRQIEKKAYGHVEKAVRKAVSATAPI